MRTPFFINIRGKLVEDSFKDRLGRSVAAPIRRSLDYQGIARRAFVIDQLPPGALPIYDRDPDIGTLVTHSRIFGGRVTVPQFEIYSNPTVKISEVQRRRFNVIDRGINKLHINISGKLVDKSW